MNVQVVLEQGKWVGVIKNSSQEEVFRTKPHLDQLNLAREVQQYLTSKNENVNASFQSTPGPNTFFRKPCCGKTG